MAITASAIGALVGRFSNKLVHEQALMSFDALDQGVVKVDDKPTQRGVVNIKAGGFSSTGFIADGGSLPTGDSNDISQLTYDPTFLFGRLSIPRGGAIISNNPADGVDIVRELMESAGRDLGRHLGRAFYKRKVEAITTAAGNTAASGSSFSSVDVSQYRLGMTLEHRDSAGTTLKATLIVTDITLASAGANGGTVDTDGNFTTTPLANTDNLWAKGTYDNAFVSLDDCASSTGSVYGKAATEDEWKGNEDPSTATLTAETLHDVLVNVERRGDDQPTCLIANPLNRARLYEVMDGDIRYTGSEMDQYGKRLTFEGLPICVDRNAPDTHFFVFNDKAMRIHQYRPFGPEVDGDAKKGMTRGAVLVSQSTFTWDVQLVGSFQGRCNSRRSLGQMSALTA